jgi:hypothetical protein
MVHRHRSGQDHRCAHHDGLGDRPDTFGGIALQTALATPFTFAFRGRWTIVTGPDGHRDQEALFPTVAANLPVPYGSVEVDTGQA